MYYASVLTLLTMTTPHERQMDDKNIRGPIFLVKIVAGGCSIVYVRKKTRAMMDCSSLSQQTLWSTSEESTAYVLHAHHLQVVSHPGDRGIG